MDPQIECLGNRPEFRAGSGWEDCMPTVGPFEALVMLLGFLVSFGFLAWPAWRICAKAGFPGALGLLILVPLVNLLLLYFLAFADWPVMQRHKPHAGIE
jgi:hypothetical protein